MIFKGVAIPFGAQVKGSAGIGSSTDLRYLPMPAVASNVDRGGATFINAYTEALADPTAAAANNPYGFDFDLFQVFQYPVKSWKLTDGLGNVATFDMSFAGVLTRVDYATTRIASFTVATVNGSLTVNMGLSLHFGTKWFPFLTYNESQPGPISMTSDPTTGAPQITSLTFYGSNIPLYSNDALVGTPSLEIDSLW